MEIIEVILVPATMPRCANRTEDLSEIRTKVERHVKQTRPRQLTPQALSQFSRAWMEPN
ncbi:MAG: hypothetical protein U0992_00475 [Planctomycetaceae bacterium]